MALKVLHTSGSPIGEYDALDTDLSAGFKGGEVATFSSVTLATADLSAADSADGYDNVSGASRTVVTKAGIDSNVMMLADDGTAGYGVLFGVVTGGTAGQTSYGPGGGTNLGPASYVGSGKITCWATPGLFGVTLDACDTNATTGLQPTNTTLIPGAKLFVTSAGLLTPNVSNGSADHWAGNFVEFSTDRSMVTTPNRLVAALNSPTGSTGPLPSALTMAVFNFSPVHKA